MVIRQQAGGMGRDCGLWTADGGLWAADCWTVGMAMGNFFQRAGKGRQGQGLAHCACCGRVGWRLLCTMVH